MRRRGGSGGALLMPVLLTLMSAASLAAEVDAIEDAPPDWYHVEILLFAQPASDDAGGEVLLPQPRPPLPANLTVLRDGRHGPWNLGQLVALRESPGAGLQVRLVTPGLDPQIEDMIDWALRQSRPVPALTFDRDLTLAARRIIDVPPPTPEQAQQPAPEPPPTEEPPPAPEVMEPEPQEPEQATVVADDDQAEDAPPQATPPPPELALLPVPPDELLLQTEAERLARAGVRILVHVAWRLPLASGEPPLAVVLGDDTTVPLATLEIERRRFLHAHLQAWLPLASGSQPDAAGTDTAVIPVSARARMRSGETHLLDHPLVAALVRTETYTYVPATQAELPAE